MMQKTDDSLSPAQLAKISPCDWNSDIDLFHKVLAGMTDQDRREYIQAQADEVNIRRTNERDSQIMREIETELSRLQNKVDLTTR
jgi:hypothetical protein